VVHQQKHQDEALGSAPKPTRVFDEDRARIGRILDRLPATVDHAERADLASELVRAASRHEDVFEHAVLPALESRIDDTVREQMASQRSALREAMDYIHRRTQHLAARNAHADDPQGLEDAIADVSQRLVTLLALEDSATTVLIGGLDPEAKQDLEAAVEKASRHAAERPRPARTALGRIVSNVATKIDHSFEDVATPDHAGAETIEG
jgi:hypothetical protein